VGGGTSLDQAHDFVHLSKSVNVYFLAIFYRFTIKSPS